MNESIEDIYRAIPHRPPFLFVDRVIEMDEKRIVAEKRLSPDLDFFKGHYPDFPIMPGALLCESVFQAGAILLSQHFDEKTGDVPAVTRIKDAKLKKMVRPGDVIRIEAELVDRLGFAFYMKGKVLSDGKLAASLSFTCAMIPARG